MSSLQRHVVWEVIKVFVLVITATTLLMVVGGGIKEAVRKGLPPQLMLEILPFMLPEMLRFTVPGSLLFAVCLAYGRMSGANEIVAVKTSGISPWAMIWPVLAISAVLSVTTFQFYNLCATWGRPGLKRTLVESVEAIAYGMLRAEKSFRTNRFSINVKDVVGRTLVQPIIVLRPGGDRPTVTLTAAEAEIQTDFQARAIRFVCRNGELDVAGQGKLWFTGTEEHIVPFDETHLGDPRRLSPAALSMRAVPQQIRYEQACLARLHQEQSRREARREADPPGAEAERAAHQRRLWRLRTEGPRRWSNGFSCFSFALIGISVALSWRLSDNLTIFFVCFLPILILFYPLLVLGEYLATKGLLPPAAVWLPNLVLAGLALWIFRRVQRY
jgi:lipopolysaccharide export system permease protein